MHDIEDIGEGEVGALIAEAQAASVRAWNNGDLDGHLCAYADQVTTMTPTGPRVGVACIRDAFRATYFQDASLPPRLRIERVSIRALGENFAWMTARYVLQAPGGAEQAGWTTLIWRRTEVGWKIIHDHTS
jgi:uncharacterized protein (TIGR02246 family)